MQVEPSNFAILCIIRDGATISKVGGLNYFEYFPLHFKFIIDFSLSYVYMDTFLYLPDLTLTIFNFVGRGLMIMWVFGI